jgi:hypothetical protein
MWLLNNLTPFAAERTWVRDENGAEIWVVAVKGSFLIEEGGRQILNPEQNPVSRVPLFRGDPLNSSLLSECDLVHKKLRTDVLVEGDAVAPYGIAARTLDVRLKLASIDKTLRVYGDRLIDTGFGMSLSEPEPFTRIPIVYERSYGGTDQRDADPRRHGWEPRNPVGVGFATHRRYVDATPAPNIEFPDSPYRGWEKGKPAGFGPVARHWSPRVQLAGTYDQRWEETRKPLLPADFDAGFYQCAPRDQQTDDFLKGGETVEIHNMSVNGHLSFLLPRVTFRLHTRFYDGTTADHDTVLHTVILQPNQCAFQMVWHSQLPCHHKVNKLEVTRVSLKSRIHVSASDVAAGVWMGAS